MEDSESADLKQRIEDVDLQLLALTAQRKALIHQAAAHKRSPRAPRDPELRHVAVIGGQGGMGALMARLFGELGHTVKVADLTTALTPFEAAAAADVVVVSVPILQTEAVIRAIGPHVRSDALLMDVTSLKEFPLKAMLASTSASVVGTHPMFGPGVHSLQSQRVVVCSGRGEPWENWLRNQLQAAGLVLKDATAAEHDRIMAVVQVLTHYRTQVVGLALARLGVSVEESLAFTSPIYQMELWMTGRHFAQSPDLYGPIEMLNPRSGEVTAAFRAAAEEVAGTLEDRDQTHFAELFAEVRSYFGDFTRTAQEQSSQLIDRVVERL